MLARVWRSRLTWRASIALTASACLIFLATAGISGTPRTIVALVFLLGWIGLLARMADNEARHIARLAQAKGSPAPEWRLRRLLFPWWARVVLTLGVLAVTLAGISRFEDGLAVLTFVLALGAAWLVEQAVIALRRPRG